MSRCGKCHRVLKNPASIDRGYGPVCWAAMVDDHQLRLFDDPADASDYDYSISGSDSPVLVIIDRNLGRRSVTNNIEAILAKIQRETSIKPQTIIYRDSDGCYDGIKVGENGRATFIPLVTQRPVKSEQEAVRAARMAQG